MSHKFDHFDEQSMSLFVQHRARIALDFSILWGYKSYKSRDEYLWFSTRIVGDDSESDLSSVPPTDRGFLAKQLGHLETRMGNLEGDMSHVKFQVDRLAGSLGSRWGSSGSNGRTKPWHCGGLTAPVSDPAKTV